MIMQSHSWVQRSSDK